MAVRLVVAPRPTGFSRRATGPLNAAPCGLMAGSVERAMPRGGSDAELRRTVQWMCGVLRA